MSSSIREIIIEALSRANIVSRKQPAPATMVENAFNLLKGIAGKFSNDNLLQFLRREVEFVPHSKVSTIGVGNVDIVADCFHDVKSVYIKNDDGYTPLDFVSYEDFYNDGFGNGVYSFQPITDKYGNIYLKDRVVELGKPLKVIYNVKWEFDLNSELFVPEQYIELFTIALTHKLALTYPRLSSEQVSMLKQELEEMVENVKVPTRANKMILRKPTSQSMSYSAFIRGDFL